MAIATTAVGDDGVRALFHLAEGDIAAKRRRSARLDGAHHLQLCVADMVAGPKLASTLMMLAAAGDRVFRG